MKKERFSDVADINISVSDDSQFLSAFSEIGKPVISADVADFLENSTSAFSPAQSLRLTVYGKCIDEEEKPKYSQAIRNYFSLKLSDTRREVRRKSIQSIIFCIVGILALVAMFCLSSLSVNGVWTECVDIFAWVFLWEAVDLFFIERSSLILREKRLRNFVEMEIIYL